MQWTAEQIIALAPDAASVKAGQGLVTLGKWQNLGRSASASGTTTPAVWGECQGSGSKPYLAQVDLSEPAFKCSCPSRKFPCKHGLGLLLLLAQDEAPFAEQSPPDWVEAWLNSRQTRQAKKSEKPAETQAELQTKQADPIAQSKRAASRSAKVEAGIAELNQWLGDLLRQGLATPLSSGSWQQISARMVDAQAPGLDRRLQDMASTVQSGEGWTDRLVEQLGQLQLILESYSRIETLPAALQADVRSQIGWTSSQAEVLAVPERRVQDRWWVLGQRDQPEEPLRSRRIWLWGEASGRSALLLLFAYGSQPFELTLIPGTIVEMEVAFFESAYPQRAIVAGEITVVDQTISQPIDQPIDQPIVQSIDEAMERYSQALCQQPWIDRMVVIIGGVVPIEQGDKYLIWDGVNLALPIRSGYDNWWELVAVSGGRPIDLCGEWNGQDFNPLSAWVDGQFIVI
jgi:uncharacterized Zn finger protein